MDLHQLEDRSDINSDSERLEVSPRSRGKVKHMKAYFEPTETKDDDLTHYTSSNYHTSVHSFTSDAEVKFSKFDIHTSVEEHQVCPECGDFQTECKCKQLKAAQKELPEPQRTITSNSDIRPSECSFISNASLSTLLPHPSSSSNELFGSDASIILGSSHGDGKHIQELDGKEHADLGKQEQHGLDAGDYCKIVPKDQCKPNEGEGAEICVNKENDVLPDDSVSSLLLFPPSVGVCSEDNIQQNKMEDLNRTSTSDLLSLLEKEDDHSSETANRDNNLNINQEGYKEENVPEEEKMIRQEVNIELKLKVKETETNSDRENLLTESFQKENKEILTPQNDLYKTVECVPTIQMDDTEESQQNATTLQHFEHTLLPGDLSYEKTKQPQVQKSEEDVKSCDDQSSIIDAMEYDNTKSDDTSVINYQHPEQISDLSEHQDEWVSDIQDITHIAINKSLFGESSESLLHEDVSPEIIKSDTKNDDLNITERKEHLCENSNQIVLPQGHYHEYQDLNISTKHYLQHHHNEWTLGHENMTDITENESLYENSDNVSLAESSPKLVVYGSSKDALKKVIHNQIFFPKNDKLGYLKSGKITDQDTVNSLTTFLSDKYSTQEQLAKYFDELDSARCKLMQDILKKDDKIDQLKKKIDVIENEIRYINRENTVLTNILANCSKRENDLDIMEQENQKNKELQRKEKICQKFKREEQHLEMSAEEQFLKEKCAELREKTQKIITEIASLQNVANKHRHEYECAVMAQKQATERIIFLKEKILTAEQECKKTNLIKEEYAEKEQQINLYEQRLIEAKNDLEELKTMVQEQASQAESYKKKYHQAEQELEELKHKLETTGAQNKLMINSAESEVQRVKDKLQEELQTLNSLTAEMEEAQTKFQEESQKRYVTEQQCEELLKQVQDINDKLFCFQITHSAKELDLQKNNLQQNEKHRESLKELLTDVTRRNSELKDEIALFCSENFRLKEMKQQVEKRSLEKAVELEKLAAQIADVDEGFSVRLKREKDNGEQMKQEMEKEIAELERDIAMYRATASKAQEEKEEDTLKLDKPEGSKDNTMQAIKREAGTSEQETPKTMPSRKMQTPRAVAEAVDVNVLRSKIETLSWQLRQAEQSRQMYKEVMDQVAKFLKRAHISLDIMHNKLDTNVTCRVPRSRSVHTVDASPVRHSQSSDFPRTKSIAQIEGSQTSSAFKDFTWRRTRKVNKNADEITPAKLAEEAFRLLRIVQSLMNTNEPDLAQSLNGSLPGSQRSSLTASDELPASFHRRLNVGEVPKYPAPRNCSSFLQSASLEDRNSPDVSSIHSSSSKMTDGADFEGGCLTSGLEAGFSGSVTSNSKESTSCSNIGISKKHYNGFSNRITETSSASYELINQVKPQAHQLSEDESGFSSMNSFQDVGLPLMPSPKMEGSFQEVGLPVVEETEMIPKHRRWSSSPVQTAYSSQSVSFPSETFHVLWV